MPEFKIYLLNDCGRVTARADVVHDDIETAPARAVTAVSTTGAACTGRVTSPLQRDGPPCAAPPS